MVTKKKRWLAYEIRAVYLRTGVSVYEKMRFVKIIAFPGKTVLAKYLLEEVFWNCFRSAEHVPDFFFPSFKVTVEVHLLIVPSGHCEVFKSSRTLFTNIINKNVVKIDAEYWFSMIYTVHSVRILMHTYVN